MVEQYHLRGLTAAASACWIGTKDLQSRCIQQPEAYNPLGKDWHEDMTMTIRLRNGPEHTPSPLSWLSSLGGARRSKMAMFRNAVLFSLGQ